VYRSPRIGTSFKDHPSAAPVPIGGIGEVDVPVASNSQVIRRVESLAIEVTGERFEARLGRIPGGLEQRDSAIPVLGEQEPIVRVEDETVRPGFSSSRARNPPAGFDSPAVGRIVTR
jgi:hypothetical protein